MEAIESVDWIAFERIFTYNFTGFFKPVNVLET